MDTVKKVLNKPAVVAWKARHHKTDDEIASILGVTANTFSRWLNGKSTIPGPELVELERITGIAAKDLIEDQQEVA